MGLLCEEVLAGLDEKESRAGEEDFQIIEKKDSSRKGYTDPNQKLTLSLREDLNDEVPRLVMWGAVITLFDYPIFSLRRSSMPPSRGLKKMDAFSFKERISSTEKIASG
jgi:hypothetical protein